MKVLGKAILLSVVFTVFTLASLVSFGETAYKFIPFPEGYTTAADEGSGYFHYGLLGVKKEVEGDIIYDYMDEDGNIKNYPYATGMEFSQGLAPAIKDGKVGYINLYGGEVVPFVYDFVVDGTWAGNPEDYPKLSLGKFEKNTMIVFRNKTVDMGNGPTTVVNSYEIKIDGKRTVVHNGSETYSRNEGSPHGYIEREEVEYNGKKYEVKFVNDIGILYSEYIKTEPRKTKSGVEISVIVEKRKVPVLVKRYHSVKDKNFSIEINGQKYSYLGYDINDSRYIAIDDFLYFLSKSNYNLGIEIMELQGAINLTQGGVYKGEKIEKKVEADLPRVPVISDYIILLNKKEYTPITTYQINDMIFINFERALRGIDVLPIRDDKNNIVSLDVTKPYEKPINPLYAIFESGRVKDDIARKYLDEAIKTLRFVREGDKYYLEIVLPSLPDEDFMRWDPYFSVKNNNGNIASSSYRTHSAQKGGSYKWEIEGLKPSHFNNKLDIEFTLNIMTKVNSSASIFETVKNNTPGKLFEYNPATEDEIQRDFDTTQIFEKLK